MNNAKNNFWKTLPKPFFVLAPMADVTDASFRRVIAKYGKPDVMWTEFVSADGLIRATPVGKAKLLKDLEYSEAERPIVAQLFGSNVENMEKAAALVAELGFNGIDLNMGCPDKGIEKQLCGAAMIKNPAVAKAIIQACKRGAPNIPISVKTRVGYNKVELEEWIPALLEEDISALTVHARTRKEMSKVPARWEYVLRAVEIRNEMKKDTLIIGNGDVKNLEEGRVRVLETGCDGIMIGRGIFGNPFLFANLTRVRRGDYDEHHPTLSEQLTALLEHTQLFDEILGTTKNFVLMKKHFKSYVQNFPNAGDLREKLMAAKDAKEVAEILEKFLGTRL